MAFLEAYNVEAEIPTGTGTNFQLLVQHTETRTPIAGMFMFSNCASYGSETADHHWLVVLATASEVAFSGVYAKDGETGTSAVYGKHSRDATDEYKANILDDAGANIQRVVISADAPDDRGPIVGGWEMDLDVNTLGVTKVVGTLFFGEGRSAEIVSIPTSVEEGAYSLPTTIRGDCGVWIGPDVESAGTQAVTCIGYHSGTTQAAFGRWEEDGAGTSSLRAFVADDACHVYVTDIERTHYAVTAVNDISIDFNITTPVAAAERGIKGLIFDLDSSQSAYVGVSPIPSSISTGAFSVATGFRPQWMSKIHTNTNSVDIEYTSSSAEAFGVSAMDSAGVGYSLAVHSDDGVGTTSSETQADYSAGGGQWSDQWDSNASPNHRMFSYTGVPFDDAGFVLREGEYESTISSVRLNIFFALQAATPTFTGYSSSLKLLWDIERFPSSWTTAVNGEDAVQFTSTGDAGRTYWGSDGLLKTTVGNELAWNTDPVTGVVGLQCHAAYVNDFTQSENPSSTDWVKTGTPDVTSSYGVGPDGVSGSSSLIGDAQAGAQSGYYQDIAITGGETYTVHWLIKKDSIPESTRVPAMYLRTLGGGTDCGVIANIDTSTGDYNAGSWFGTNILNNAGVKDRGDWWELWATVTDVNDGNTNFRVTYYPARNSDLSSLNGNNTTEGTVEVFGHQATESPVPLPYFKTTGTAAGPSADIPQMDTDFSWYNTLGGTFAFDFTMPDGDNPTSSRVFNVSDGGTSDYWDTNTAASGSLQTKIFSGSVSQVSKTSDVNAEIGGRFRVATAATNADGYRTAINGFFDAAVSSPTMPVGLSEINLGARHGESLPSWLMYLHSLRYYDTRIPDGGPQAGEDDLSLYNLSMGLVDESAATPSSTATLVHHWFPKEDQSLVSRAVGGYNSNTYRFDVDGTPDADTRSYYDENGLLVFATGTDEPRYTYNPTTLASRGLIVERASRNYWTNSEDISSWTVSEAAEQSVGTTDPTGASTLDKLVAVDNNLVEEHYAERSSFAKDAAAERWSLSVFVQEADYDYIELRIGAETAMTNSATAKFRFSTEEFEAGVSNGTFTFSHSVVEVLPNSIYRIGITGLSGTEATIVGQIALANDAGDVSFDPTSANLGTYAWGSQLEEFSIMSSYIRNTGAAANRWADDEVRLNGALGDDLSWWNVPEGMWYVDFIVPANLPTDNDQQTILFHDSNEASVDYMILAQGLTSTRVEANTTEDGTDREFETDFELTTGGRYRMTWGYNAAEPDANGREYVISNGTVHVDDDFNANAPLASSNAILRVGTHASNPLAADQIYILELRYYEEEDLDLGYELTGGDEGGEGPELPGASAGGAGTTLWRRVALVFNGANPPSI